MSRAIKFRAWHTEFGMSRTYTAFKDGGIVEFDTCSKGALGDIQNHTSITSSRLEWMQFTDLHDKNGVAIYEGDVVAWLPWEGEPIKRVAAVSFENGCFYTKWLTSKYRLGGWNPKSIEVIGNIHEHPDLLTPGA